MKRYTVYRIVVATSYGTLEQRNDGKYFFSRRAAACPDVPDARTTLSRRVKVPASLVAAKLHELDTGVCEYGAKLYEIDDELVNEIEPAYAYTRVPS